MNDSSCSLTGHTEKPDEVIDGQAQFGLNEPFEIRGFSKANEYVPDFDDRYQFSAPITRAILMGFMENRRVYVHGPHGSGKTSHIEQVAARLKWPCVRINLDGHVSRSDLIGRDMIVIKDGKQVTQFMPGILVWALERPVALVFDEYDAGRPDVMFVIQRVLESEGKFTLLDQNRVINPHPFFRLFATGNTAGQGDSSGMYIGTQPLNQAQMDRWQMVVRLPHLSADSEVAVLRARVPIIPDPLAKNMVSLANLCRQAHRQGDLTSLVSLRTLITWCENYALMKNCDEAFRLTFLDRCDDLERPLVEELYQRCFGVDLHNLASYV